MAMASRNAVIELSTLDYGSTMSSMAMDGLFLIMDKYPNMAYGEMAQWLIMAKIIAMLSLLDAIIYE